MTISEERGNSNTRGAKSFVQDPGRVAEFAQAIAEGSLSPVSLVERYLDRISTADGDVQAWRLVDADRATSLARDRAAEAKSGRIRGPLHGIPFAVKDIIDVEGLTTLCNSKSRAKSAPASADAEIVLAFRAAGAIPLGKVHTTEFAFFDPSPARNPHNIEHTPGGSSSGSAAAVASGSIPLAIGTQTVASVNRPAAYCGIAAFKPSTGSMVGYGITPLAPSFDTAGLYGFTVEDAVTVYKALQPAFLVDDPAATAAFRVIVLEDEHLADMTPEMRSAVGRMAAAVANSGIEVVRIESPVSFKRLFELQQLMMHYEASRSLRFLSNQPAGMVGKHILGVVTKGSALTLEQYIDARNEIMQARGVLLGLLKEDCLLWPATPGPAPHSLSSTGDPRYIAPWTAIGGPIVTIPAGVTASGLPLGCILTSRPGSDTRMCHMAVAVARASRC